MAWPKPEYVGCYGFDRSLLPVIQRACDGGMVEWVDYSLGFLEGSRGVFKWADCTWQMDEMNEWVESVTLTEGTPDSESLTIALLKGKIEAS
jgi:hypothetical protein